MSAVLKSKLPRLPREFYQGFAFVLWTHTTERRATGWLDHAFHARFRELLLHACHRFHLVTPCYLLMPDHWHIVWTGVSARADQWLATAFLRRHLQPTMRVPLQDRAHDHVLREAKREHGAFQSACHYVCENPERANLCPDWHDWPYVGSMVPGYPDLHPHADDFRNTFWRIHAKVIQTPALPALTRRATSDRSLLRACQSKPWRRLEQRDVQPA